MVIVYYIEINSHSSLGLFPYNVEVIGAYNQFLDDDVYWLTFTADGDSFIVSHDIVTNAYKKICLLIASDDLLVFIYGLYIFEDSICLLFGYPWVEFIITLEC